MPRVDEEIAQSRARKSATIKKVAIGSLCLAALSALGAVAYYTVATLEFGAPAATPNSDEAPVVTDATPVDRAALQQSLDASRQMLTASLSAPVTAWAPERSQALTGRLEQAYQAYGMGEYAKVNASLQRIDEQVTQLIDDYQLAFQAPFTRATQAFDEEDMRTAAKHNQQALSVNPDFADALALQMRIDAFNDVEAMYEQARIGHVENNLAKQRDAYARIVELDPKRSDARAELARINAQLSENNFKQALRRAVATVDAGNTAAAQQHLDDAAAIKPGSPEVATLQARIDTLDRQQGAKAVEEKIQMFTRLDEWQTVKMLADKAIGEYPSNAVIRRALDSANAVQAAHKRLDRYLSAPSRLADNTIRQNAYNALSDVSALSQMSNTLGEKITQLERLIEQENVPLDVTVTSDGNAHLKVLGVGHIGEVQQKTIQLKPGNYQLEASRAGYRTVIQDLVVQKSAMPIVVHLECSEKI